MSTVVPPPDAPRDRRAARRGPDPFRWMIEHPGIIDTALFGGVTALMLFVAVLSWPAPGWFWWSVPMIAAGAILRTHPGWATLCIGVIAVAHLAAGSRILLGDVMIFYALYCCIVHARPLVGRLALAAAFLGALIQGLVSVHEVLVTLQGDLPGAVFAAVATVVFGCALVLAAWGLGKYQRARVDQLRHAHERALQAEREREQRAALAVAGERARIAREMHDVVAHSLAVIIAQADGGRFAAGRHPEQAAAALETISATGRAALADMRSLLGVLRTADDEEHGPQPDLGDLPELLVRVRAAGLPVRLETRGRLDDLSPALGLSMYRLVQEALTNVLKHAGPGARAEVRIARDVGQLEVEVRDDGRGGVPGAAGEGGHGLAGMRERTALFGGTLHTGPRPTGGFAVHARLPLS
ncbi:MAG: sensor histidine kinase, partial [Brachybacterium sp.]|nr:sensor histidine kinase [Brachybacterium sp.]